MPDDVIVVVDLWLRIHSTNGVERVRGGSGPDARLPGLVRPEKGNRQDGEQRQ